MVVVPATVLLVGYLAASHPETTSAALVGTYGWVSEHPAITSAGEESTAVARHQRAGQQRAESASVHGCVCVPQASSS